MLEFSITQKIKESTGNVKSEFVTHFTWDGNKLPGVT